MISTMLRRMKHVFVNFLIFFFSSCLRRNKKIVIVGAWMGEKYADNSRFLFQYLADHKEQSGIKKVIWVTRSSDIKKRLENYGYNVVLVGTLSSFYWHCKSGVHIICNYFGDGSLHSDIDTNLSAGAVKIQLWHGNGIKRVPGNRGNISRIKKVLLSISSKGMWFNDNYFLLCKSDMDFVFFEKKFGASKDYCIDAAYPRNCVCEKFLPEELDLLDKLKKYNKIIIYLPTFRKDYENFVHPLTNNELVNWLEANNYLWIEKPHTADPNSTSMSKYQNACVITLDSAFDINVLLSAVDVVITDYSAVMLDALYYRKPIVYYVPDFNYYQNNDRGFLVNYDDVCITPRINNIEDLKDGIINAMHIEQYDERAEKIRSKFWKHDDWTCEDIWNEIKKKTKLEY